MKRILLFEYKISTGELQVGLPLVKEITNGTNFKVFFYFPSSKIFCNISEIDRSIIRTLGSVLIGPKSFLMFITSNLRSHITCMTCDSGAGKIVRTLYKLSNNVQLFYFHHAYAFHNISNEDMLSHNSNNFIKRYLSQDAYMLANYESDRDYYCNVGFLKEKIVVTGALGYRSGWIQYYRTFKLEDNTCTEESIRKQYKKIVFVPMRHVHHQYLSKQNYEYLIDSIVKLVEKYNDYFFLLKKHPRQINDTTLDGRFAPYINVQFTTESTIINAEISDITISFWSSAILDSLSVGTFALEFHRHHVFHSQLIYNEKGDMVSLYSSWGLCPFVDNLEALYPYLDDIDGIDYSVYEEKFKEVMGLDESVVAQSMRLISTQIAKSNCFSVLSKLTILFKISMIIIRGIVGKIKNKCLKKS